MVVVFMVMPVFVAYRVMGMDMIVPVKKKGKQGKGKDKGGCHLDGGNGFL